MIDGRPHDPPTLVAAMTVLGPWVGNWHVAGRTISGGRRVGFEQRERVELLPGGEVLSVEGRGSVPGKPDDIGFTASAVASYDPVTCAYRWRSSSAGYTVDVALQVRAPGPYGWGCEFAPGLLMSFDIRIEQGCLSMDNGDSWEPTLSMELKRLPAVCPGVT